MECKSCIKNYKNLRKRNLKNKKIKIISLKSKGSIKDLKRERYLSGFYNKNSNIKIELV